MTNTEFKAWFDGFTEAMDAVPNKKQWDRIKAKVKEIDGSPITRHYVDRYWPGGYPFWGSWGIGVSEPLGPLYSYSSNSCVAGQTQVSNNLAGCQGGNAIDGGGSAQSFNTQDAMYALGQLEGRGEVG